jgi:hypothetical protein
MRKLLFALIAFFAISFAAPIYEAEAAYLNLPTSVCSSGSGQIRVYDPHNSGEGYVQTWGEMICNQTNKYFKVELYYYYNSTGTWKRVAYQEKYTTKTSDFLVVNQCAVPSSSGHVWQARAYTGGGHYVWSNPVAMYMKIGADGTC